MMWKEKEEKEEEKEQYESCNTLTPSERGSDGGRPTAGGDGRRTLPTGARIYYVSNAEARQYVCLSEMSR